MSVVLACDLGGTHFRAALVDQHGHSVAQHTHVSPSTALDDRGRSETDPDDWWETLLALAAELAETAPQAFAKVKAVALGGITRTQVLIGADGRPLRRAITWRDVRAEPSIRQFVAQLPQRHPETIQVNAFHPLARLAWLRDHEPDTLRAATAVLEPKDYLNFRLTGVRSTDRISMARLIAAATPAANEPDLLTAAGIAPSILPPIVAPCDRVGRIEGAAPAPFNTLAGIPVFSGSNDTWSAVVGLGALQPDHAYNLSGTTEVFGVLSETAHNAEGLITIDWGGLHQLGGPGQNGADTVAWLLSLLGLADAGRPFPADALAALLAGRRNPQALLFLPYLQGERVPWWDAALRGAFVGLNRSHTSTDMAWAVLEGVAFHNKLVLNRAEEALGHAVSEIRFGGGAASNPLWRQIKADICERAVVVGAASEPGIVGAAAVAWTGLGVFASLREAQQKLARIAQRCEPDPARTAFYRPLFDLYRRSASALAPISHQLVALQRDDFAAPPS
ncbi:MAG TPA: FGGY-family carbohydrate kinase [Paraburkholderia sp.]